MYDDMDEDVNARCEWCDLYHDETLTARSYPELLERLISLYNVRLGEEYVGGPFGREHHQTVSLGYGWSSYHGDNYDVVTERTLRANYGEYLMGGDGDDLSLDLCQEIPEETFRALVEEMEYLQDMGYVGDSDMLFEVEEERIEEAWDSWLSRDVFYALQEMWDANHPGPVLNGPVWDTWDRDQDRFYAVAGDLSLNEFREAHESDEINPCGDYWLNEHDSMIPLDWEALTIPVLYDALMAKVERDTSRDPGEGQGELF